MTVNPYRLAEQVWPGHWRESANCITADPDLFHPTDGNGHWIGRHQATEAKAVCSRCPVIAECLAWAMDEDYGIAGGLTAAERRVLKEAS